MRTCGTCAMCCRLLGVPGVKENHTWCPHCTRHSCAIYTTRPQLCHDFNCEWVRDLQFADYWYPKHAKIVISTADKGLVLFIVDPAYPTRWREEPWFSDIKQVAKVGLAQGYKTIVSIKDSRIPFTF
jgi:uncharacterized protein